MYVLQLTSQVQSSPTIVALPEFQISSSLWPFEQKSDAVDVTILGSNDEARLAIFILCVQVSSVLNKKLGSLHVSEPAGN